MSLLITLEILGATPDELKALAPKLPSTGGLTFRAQKDSLLFWKWKGFTLEGAEEGLVDPTIAKRDYWVFNPETTKNLKELFAKLAATLNRRFYVFAAESGELPKRESELDVNEFLEMIDAGHIGNKVKYLVKPVVKNEFAGEQEAEADQPDLP